MAALTGGKLGLLLRIDMQQVVAERRFAAFFTRCLVCALLKAVYWPEEAGGTHRDRE